MNYASFNNTYDSNPEFELYDEDKYKSMPRSNMRETALKGMECIECQDGKIISSKKTDKISEIFFSGENMDRIQKMIQREVIKISRGKIKLEENQEESDLLIVMRSIYLQECRHLPFKTVKQVKMLNTSVVNTIVPELMTNIKQHYGYLKDISEPIKPISRPMNVNNAGRRSLPSITTIWEN